MNQILEQFPQISIDVFNSRRTPSVISSQFVENPKYSDNNRHIRFHDFQKSGFRSNSQAYANDLIFVTADSMSMISEAVSAQRPVIVIVPRGYKIPSADQIELNYFERLNHFKIWNLNRPGMPIPDISNIKIMSENHISDLSNKLFLILTGKKTGTGH
jgi:mitochondrial fission protein ELM1